MTDLYDLLPEPAALTQGLIVDFLWSDETYQLLCLAASIRIALWDGAGEPITWLHCLATRFQVMSNHDPVRTRQLFVPTQYITSIGPGPPLLMANTTKAPDIGLFEPRYPSPRNALPLFEIEKALAQFQLPAIA